MVKFRRVAILISSILLIFIGVLVFRSDKGILFDIWILNWVQDNLSSSLVSFMVVVSFLGSEAFLFPTMAIVISYLVIKKRYYLSALLLSSSLGSFIVNFLLKVVFQRTRPLGYFLVDQGGFSYPSGHTMVSTTMFLSLAYLYSTGKPEKKKKYAYAISISYIILMGFSRISLGVHWPTDIIGGLLGGYIFYELAVLKIPKTLD